MIFLKLMAINKIVFLNIVINIVILVFSTLKLNSIFFYLYFFNTFELKSVLPFFNIINKSTNIYYVSFDE